MTPGTAAASAPAGSAPAETSDRDRRVLVDLVRGAFDDAAAAAGVHVRTVRIGREVVRLRFAGPALVERMTRAFAPLLVDDATPATTTLDAWDSESTGRRLPMLVADLLRLLDLTWLGDRGRRGELRDYSFGPVRAAYYGPRLLSTYDVADRHGVFWLEDEAALPWYEPGSPFRVLLDWALAGRRRQLVHGGAIAGERGGVLLGGPGGSGKSTTALACLGAPGLRYVSDDYVTVDLADGPVAWSMYATAKVKTALDAERFPSLRAAMTNLDRVHDGVEDGEKPMLFVHEVLPGALAPSTPLKALVFPRYVAADDCRIVPLRQDVAFKLLAPSTVQQVPTDAAGALRCMRELASALPAFGLGLPRDPQLIPAAVRTIIEELT